jgi:hypothetical protein
MRALCACLSLFLASSVALAQDSQTTLEFSGRTWTVIGQDVKVEDYLGQEAVRFRNGAILLPDVDFENGTVEFDIATTGQRSFVGLAFRADLARNSFEDFYLRPHQTGRFDAMQYTPVFHGISAWQLYPEYNSAIEIPREEWLHVKLVISGSQLEAYLGGTDEPALVVGDLKRGEASGLLALKANFPAAAQQPEAWPTAFANFSVSIDDTPGDYREASRPAPQYIREWSVSPAFAPQDGTMRELPATETAADGWSTVVSESSGLVNLARFRSFPQGTGGGAILARVVILSDRDQVKKLDFGLSDRGSIFLNGEVVFSGDNTYRSRSQRYLGVVTIDNDAIYLRLNEGANELTFAVSEAFGGWGLIARFEDMEGISVEAAPPGS